MATWSRKWLANAANCERSSRLVRVTIPTDIDDNRRFNGSYARRPKFSLWRSVQLGKTVRKPEWRYISKMAPVDKPILVKGTGS